MGLFQGSLEHIKSLSRKICFVVVVVAASRAEGGLVCIQETNCMEGNAQFSLKIPDIRLNFSRIDPIFKCKGN